jgi:hypothetical protein
MSSARSIVATILAAASCALIGCNTEGGRGFSSDSYTYVSRTWSPKTVTLFDTRTGETLWSVDLPVGKQMSVGFRRGTGPNEYKPDMMYWGMTEPGRLGRVQKNWIPVPPHYSRRLDLTLREAPESPGITMPGSPFDPNIENYAASPSTSSNPYSTNTTALYPALEPAPPAPVEITEPAQETEPTPDPAAPQDLETIEEIDLPDEDEATSPE